MSDKVYILLNIIDGNTERVVKTMRKTPGVVTVEALEGPPDVILVMEATDRQCLAKLAIQALARVGTITELIQLLPINAKCTRPSDNRVISKKRGDENGKNRKVSREGNFSTQMDIYTPRKEVSIPVESDY